MDPLPSRPPHASRTTWLIVAIIVAIAGGSWYSLSRHAVTKSTNTTTTQVPGRYSHDGISFTYPTYLSVRPNYPNELDSADATSTIQIIRVTRLSSEFVNANGSIGQYVDNFVVEFPGHFTVTAPVTTTAVNTLSVVYKEYGFRAAVNATTDASLERVAVATKGAQHLLIEMTGNSGTDFGTAFNNVLQSLAF